MYIHTYSTKHSSPVPSTTHRHRVEGRISWTPACVSFSNKSMVFLSRKQMVGVVVDHGELCEAIFSASHIFPPQSLICNLTSNCSGAKSKQF